MVLGGALLSGVLLYLAMPPISWAPLAWVMFLPLFWAVRGRGFALGFLGGMVSCLVAAVLGALGLFLPLAVADEGSGWVFAGYAIFGTVTGAVSGLLGEKETRGWPFYMFASLAVLFEAAWLAYLPVHVALSQAYALPWLFLTSGTGVWGVSFCLWAVPVWLVTEPRARPAIVAALCLGASLVPARLPDSGTKVGLVQTQSQVLTELAKLQASLSKEATLTIWPELAGIDACPRGDTSKLEQFARRNNTAIVTSYNDQHDSKPHNVCAAFFPTGRSETYFKRKLFAAERALHTPGDRAVAVRGQGTVFGLNVCFDSCFSSIIRETASLDSVRFIALPTLDPPTRFGVAQAIHAAYSPFRSAENGIAILRADTTAYSSVTDGLGRSRVLGVGELVATVRVDLRRQWTLYQVLGDWFLLACGVLVLLGLRAARRQATFLDQGLRSTASQLACGVEH